MRKVDFRALTVWPAVLSVACQAATGGIQASTTVANDSDEPRPPRFEGGESAPETTNPPELGWSEAGVRRYLGRLSLMVARRPLERAELEAIAANPSAAVDSVIAGWMNEPGVETLAREWISDRLAAGGQARGIDFDLPGNLAAVLVRQRRPWQEIVSAQQCYDRAGDERPCDTGAPYAAGVLTTRAFLAAAAGRFNLTRSSLMMGLFACREYPMEPTLEPPIPKAWLIPMFQASAQDEQTDERAKGGFGNGRECYACHSQFAPHAQLFVRFDEEGLYRANAEGQQDPNGELGRSSGSLMASHYADPTRAAQEASQMFGVEVANLQEAGQVLGDSEVFFPCMVVGMMRAVLGLGPDAAFDRLLVQEIVDDDFETSDNPTFQELLTAIFTHPLVADSVIRGLDGGEP